MRGISIISSVPGLQESSSVEIEREVRTLVWFLRETVMEDVDRGRRRRSFKERLRFKGMACCGSTWGLRPSTISVRDDDDEQEQDPQQEHHRTEAAIDPPAEGISDPGCVGQVSASSGMNLATALAAERHFRSTQYSDGSNVVGTAPGTPLRVSLMRLLEESSEGVDGGETEKEKGGGGNDSVCCVCMGRKKGSAFIPCGHTFCRVCSRELWLNRGSCPLCNRSVLEILDIF